MSGLDIAAIGMLLFLAGLAIALVVFLGGWPGRVATKRQHPFKSAVSIGGWVTLVAGGVFYPLVLIWAYAGTKDAEVAQLEDVT